MSLYAVDVSDWQPDIDWPSVRKAGFDIAIFKASESIGNVQSTFEYNRAETSGWPYVGIYHFARPEYGRVLAEAEHYCAVVGSLRANEFPILDIETGSTALWPSFISTWCGTVEDKLGKKPIVYMSESPAKQMPPDTAAYPLWVAGYVAYDPVWEDWQVGPWDRPAMWQYTSSGRVPGIKGNVDCNVAPDDFALRIGLVVDPAPKPIPTPVTQNGDDDEMVVVWSKGAAYAVDGGMRSKDGLAGHTYDALERAGVRVIGKPDEDHSALLDGMKTWG